MRTQKISPKKKRNVDGNKLSSIINNPPLNWETVYSSIKEYRKNTIAPVDTMGCNKLADDPNDKITPQVFTKLSYDNSNLLFIDIDYLLLFRLQGFNL